MHYNIYEHINDQAFENISARIARLAPDIIKLMSSHRFKLNKESLGGDILGMDFLFKDNTYDGTIGFLFDDLDTEQTFSFYTLKAKDVNKKRYYKRINLHERVTLDTIENNYQQMFADCINEYNRITDADLTEFLILKSPI